MKGVVQPKKFASREDGIEVDAYLTPHQVMTTTRGGILLSKPGDWLVDFGKGHRIIMDPWLFSMLFEEKEE